MIISNILRVIEILCSMKLVLERKEGREKPESLRLEILKMISANTFALQDTEDRTSGPSNRGRIAEFPFLQKHY